MKNIIIGVLSFGAIGILAGPMGVVLGAFLGGFIGNSINHK
jgi:hypothetical protein